MEPNTNILNNIPLWSSVIATVLAQLLKPVFNLIQGNGFSKHMLVSTGGMPSSHTAAVVSLTSSIGLIYGVGSVSFAISFVVAVIVMHDAMNIRMEAGKQAQIINEWSDILSKLHQNAFEPTNLKTLLGHSFSQVMGGIFLGLVIGLVFPLIVM